MANSDVTVVGCILCHTKPRTLTSELCEECFTLRTVAANDDVHNWGTNVEAGDKILVTIDGKMHKATCAGWRTHNGVRHVRTDIMTTIGFYDAPFSDVRIIKGVREILQASELARLQAENRRYRAFVEELTPYQTYYGSSSTTPNGKLYTIGVKAAALLASMKPADGSELAALRRQIVVLEHDRRGLYDALIEAIGEDANRIMNNIRASTPKD